MREYEERFGREFDRFVMQNYLGALKAIVIAIMIFVSIYLGNGSLGKALFVSVLCLMISLFRTWRRYLEPLSFVLLCITLAVWLDFRFDGLKSMMDSMKALFSRNL